MKRLIGLSTISILFSYNAHSNECLVNVTNIIPKISDGWVNFTFSDNTQIAGKENGTGGLNRNFSVALSALSTGKQVKVVLNGSANCGLNQGANWSHIEALP